MKRKQALFHLGACALIGSAFIANKVPWYATAIVALLAIPSIIMAVKPVADEPAA